MKKFLLSFLMLCCVTAAWAQDDGFVNVATTIQLWNAIKANDHAKVRLTADFALSDIDKDDELYCETFYGTIDGNGHTIKGDPVAPVRARTYMFYWSDGATFKNLTFKGIRVNSQSDPNQAIITAKAQNGCVFENITFENVHTFSNKDNAGGVAGWAQDCTFTNITVKNSDFTTDATQSGAVVAHAINCTFTNIKVENCESTSDDGKSGGVAGRTDGGTINNVEIHGTFIKTNSNYGGGVVGYSVNTHFTNCIVDDQSCVCVDGADLIKESCAGGIVGHGTNCNISNCINSALIAADEDRGTGGIIGHSFNSNIVSCLNTGMVISIGMNEVKESFYNKYKTKTGMTCFTKTYQGKEYVIRKYEGDYNSNNDFGGIIGWEQDGMVIRCANFGSVYGGDHIGGIAGYITKVTISDCLSDFFGDKDILGICVFKSYSTGGGKSDDNYSTLEVHIDNCLNMTTYKDFEPSNDEWHDFYSNENNYSLTTAEDAQHTNKTTADKIKSGDICLKLGANWEQNIGRDEYPTPTGNKGVYHSRKISNEYGTACLPFSVKSDDKISFYAFSEATEGDDINLKFTYVEDVEPGTPVLFRSAEAKEANADELPVEICINNAGDSFVETTKTVYGNDRWTMQGTFSGMVVQSLAAKSTYYVSGGAIKNATFVEIAPYRAYFRGPSIDNLTGNGASQPKSVRFVIEDEDGETTALELVGDDLVPVQNGKTYSLMGTEVSDGYRGIVIRNGKKVMLDR